MNCPFYGRHLFKPIGVSPTPFLLLSSAGNQCAIVTSAFTGCYMEAGGEVPDWSKCPVFKDLVVGG